jgi:hypothetical protein
VPIGDTLITAFGRNRIVADGFRRVLSAEACELTRQVKGGWCRAGQPAVGDRSVPPGTRCFRDRRTSAFARVHR